MGRISIYSDDLADEILDRLASGETLRGICRSKHIPPASTVRGWVVDNKGPGFAERYARARAMGMDEMADEIVEIADDIANDTLLDSDGNARANSEWISRSRLRVDSRKWLMSKVAANLYGDKLDVAVTGDVSFGERLAAARAKPADSDA